MLKVYIPEFAKITPSLIYWKLNDAVSSKIVKIKILLDQNVKITGVHSSNEQIYAQIKTIKPGMEYELVITPQSTTEPADAELILKTDQGKVLSIPVVIRDFSPPATTDPVKVDPAASSTNK